MLSKRGVRALSALLLGFLMSCVEIKSQRSCASQMLDEKVKPVEKAKLRVYSFGQCRARRSVK